MLPPQAPTYSAPPSFGAPGTPGASAVSGSEEVSDFVRRITQSSRFESNSVARWRTPLCFSVQGLPANENAFVVQRLTQIASAAGAPIESQGCSKGSYNFHVVFTLDADRTASDWYDRHRALFEANATAQAQINKFVEPDASPPVRVWHNATLFGPDGRTLVPVDAGEPIEAPPQTVLTGSRLTSQGVMGLNYALVIVDGTKTNHAGLASIADYLAMAGLAELNLGADVGDDPTILRLFSAPQNARPAGLTQWDRSFLSALYHAEQHPRILSAQIAGTMTQQVSP
jgi:hypothetical protein